MDKLTVSQCVTADWCRGYNAAVEQANKEINEIKKQNERLKRFLKSKIKVYAFPTLNSEHNGCFNCKYEEYDYCELPCRKCKGTLPPTSAEYKTRKDYWSEK